MTLLLVSLSTFTKRRRDWVTKLKLLGKIKLNVIFRTNRPFLIVLILCQNLTPYSATTSATIAAAMVTGMVTLSGRESETKH